MKLSVVIPARNEEGAVEETLSALLDTLRADAIPCELLVVDDGSTDKTAFVVQALSARYSEIHLVENKGRHGFGMAVRCGLREATGDAIAVVMADSSDSPEDVVKCYRRLLQGPDCVFGSRFIHGSRVYDYPMHKLVLNRLANWFIKALFGVPFNDFTNAFKLYRREVIEGMQPLISPHFNLTVEMPLKAITRGFSFAVVPISWTNRKTGISKLKIREMGSRYLFIVLYVWLEKHLARGDYHRRYSAEQPQAGLNIHHV
jgi:dolichol-phosphate mannosyltransferase